MRKVMCLFAVVAMIVVAFSGCQSDVEETSETTSYQTVTETTEETTEETTKEEIIGITDRDLLDESQKEMLDKFPEYFGLNATNGLDVIVWQMSQNGYSFGLLESDENRHTDEGIWMSYMSLRSARAEEMRIILSTYDIDREDITIVPWYNPVSSYIADYFTCREDEDSAEKKREYINLINNKLFGEENVISFTEYYYFGKQSPECKQYTVVYNNEIMSIKRIDLTNNETIWQVDYPNYNCSGCVEVSDGVIAVLSKRHLKAQDKYFLEVVKYSLDGTLKTDIILTEDEYSYEHIVNVFHCENGDLYFVSRGRNNEDLNSMTYMFTILDCNAQVKYREKYELGYSATFSFFQNINGVICIKKTTDNNEFGICFVDEKGIMSEFSKVDSFISRDSSVSVSDAVVINGNTVISFYEFDRDGVNQQINALFGCEYLGEDVTNIIKENISASLVCFNNATKESKCLLSVKGQYYGRVIVSENGFAYDFLSPETVKYSPYTSAYSFVGDFSVTRYTFSKVFVLTGGPKETNMKVQVNI